MVSSRMRSSKFSTGKQTAPSGLCYSVAESVSQVTAAWELVYRCYLRAGLIPSNQTRIHTLGRVIGPDTVVIRGTIDQLTVSTITAVIDRPDGLPSETLFTDEIKALRGDGRSLFEIGLFADRRERLFRSVDALLELMRYAIYFGLHHEATDALYCVHPDQADMLKHLFGFEPVGSARPDPRLNDRPSVLLRLDWHKQIESLDPPGGLSYFVDQPLARTAFADRFDFNRQDLEQSSIAAFCNIA